MSVEVMPAKTAAAVRADRKCRWEDRRAAPAGGANCRHGKRGASHSSIARRSAGRRRPEVEVVDMVAHVTAVATERRAVAGSAHGLHLAGAQAEIEGRLLRRK